jgi:hypothetical protein
MPLVSVVRGTLAVRCCRANGHSSAGAPPCSGRGRYDASLCSRFHRESRRIPADGGLIGSRGITQRHQPRLRGVRIEMAPRFGSLDGKRHIIGNNLFPGEVGICSNSIRGAPNASRTLQVAVEDIPQLASVATVYGRVVGGSPAAGPTSSHSVK